MGHAILSADLSAIAGAIYLPEQYKLISAHYEVGNRVIKFIVESDELPEDKIDGLPLSTLTVLHTTEPHPDDPSFRKITGKVEIT